MDPSSRLHLEVLLKVFHHYLTDREVPVQSFDFSDGYGSSDKSAVHGDLLSFLIILSGRRSTWR